ncbi:PRC-barrel domain-containing protein, partial [Arthrobacter sp. GCM10027362]|uniref:PRC-barrel domain-containing protein n=1 Tax=Arthrobacter sp. GCM10027362 TaxID=3273379 RepID=UPI003628FB76
MIARDNLDRLAGGHANVIDSEGHKIGSLGELYLDDRTNEPNWATVRTGLFGMSETFVPLDAATL